MPPAGAGTAVPVGHDLDLGLVLLDRGALVHEPLDDLALGDALADVGSLNSTALRRRRRPGPLRARPRPRARGRAAGALVEVEDHVDLALVDGLHDRAAGGRRHLDGGLVGHDLDHGLVLLDRGPFGHEPLDDLAFGDAFADVGQLELDHWGVVLDVRAVVGRIRRR